MNIQNGLTHICKSRWFWAIILIPALCFCLSACSGDDSAPADDPADQQEETVLPAEDQAAEPEDAEEDALVEVADQEKPEPVQEPAQAPESVQDTPETQEAPAQGPETGTGEPAAPQEPASQPEPEPTPAPQPQPEPEPEPDPEPTQENSRTVYITETGSKYHYDSNCGNGTYYESTLSEAQGMGLTPCKKCAGG